MLRGGSFTQNCRGNLSSSTTFDPEICQTQEKNEMKELSESFHLTMGKASEAFTEILGIIF